MGLKIQTNSVIDVIEKKDKEGGILVLENNLQLPYDILIDLASFEQAIIKATSPHSSYKWLYLELPYPNSFANKAGLISRFIPSPSGFLTLYPFLNTCGLLLII